MILASRYSIPKSATRTAATQGGSDRWSAEKPSECQKVVFYTRGALMQDPTQPSIQYHAVEAGAFAQLICKTMPEHPLSLSRATAKWLTEIRRRQISHLPADDLTYPLTA